mgnify:CR=1 FL=1
MKIKMHTQIESNDWHGRVDVSHTKFDHPDVDINEIDIDIHWVIDMRQLSHEMFEMELFITSIDLMVSGYNLAHAKYVNFIDKLSDMDLLKWEIGGFDLNQMNMSNGISHIDMDYFKRKITISNF